MAKQQLLSLHEAHRRSGLSRTTIKKSIRAGRLAAQRDGDTRFDSYRIDAAELNRFAIEYKATRGPAPWWPQ
jgi:hypothetical protein